MKLALLITLLFAFEAKADVAVKSIQSMTNSAVEDAAKLHLQTHRLYTGYGYTYRIHCHVTNTHKTSIAEACARKTYDSVVERYSIPDSISVNKNPTMDALLMALTHGKIKGSAGPLTANETDYIAKTTLTFQPLLKNNQLEFLTGYESNSFGSATFVVIYDSENSEIALFGNGYAE